MSVNSNDKIPAKLLNHRTISPNATGVVVKASAGFIYHLHVANINAAIRYLKLYDKATAATSGDTPLMTIPIPVGGAPVIIICDHGIPFSLGIGYRAVTGILDNDNTGASASETPLNIQYI
jgi:hypothetical protein